MENSNINSHYRVLSIQSHVVSGYVGNKSACFPLQVLEFEVDSINSVQLSNHTGYKHIKGQYLNAEELQELYDGLKLNNLATYSHVLTGYVGTVSFLSKLVDIIKELKKVNPDLYYVCDPVMGDNNKMYVPKEVLPVYRDYVIPLADLITPNHFEAELLTGVSITSKEKAIEALDILHKKGVETVVISSIDLESVDDLILIGSSLKGKEGDKTVVCMHIPRFSAAFTGTGDLFSALLLAWMTRTGGDLKLSCEKVINTMQSILKRTLSFESENEAFPFSLELKLIQSKKDIENPSPLLKCEVL